MFVVNEVFKLHYNEIKQVSKPLMLCVHDLLNMNLPWLLLMIVYTKTKMNKPTQRHGITVILTQ